jgi:Holliday junction resolvase RusA-like endonuclease
MTFNPRHAEMRAVQYDIKSQYDGPLLDTPISVEYIFNFPIPVSFSKKKRLAIQEGKDAYDKRPDTSNLMKFYDDCLIDTVINDDSQIVKVTAVKKYANVANTIITITPLENYIL